MKDYENEGKTPDSELRRQQYEAADTDGRLIINLRDLNHTMQALYEGRGSQRRILIVLRETGTITQKELTERLGIQPGSASEVISKLEHAGLLMRRPSESDRRTADIVLTEEGRRMADEAAEQRRRRHADMFSCLTDQEKGELLGLLEKLTEDWRERYPAAERHRRGRHQPGREHGRENRRPGGRHGAHGHRGHLPAETEES